MKLLYSFVLCPFSRKTRIFLTEKGIEFDLVSENFWRKRQEFLSLNPSGQVPVLTDSSNVLPNSNVICEYIEETNADNLCLYGNNSNMRAEIRRLVFWFDEKFHNEVGKHILNEKIIKLCHNDSPPNSKLIRLAKERLKSHTNYMSDLLDKRHWLAGERFTIADITAAAHISTLDYLGDISWNDVSEQLKEWYQLIKSRPSFKQILNDRVLGLGPNKNYAVLDF